MRRFRRALWWGVHATTILLILVMLLSYLPNSWAGKYKHNTGKPMDGVYAQYIVWSGRAECTLLFDDYDEQEVMVSLQRVLEMNTQGSMISIDHKRHPSTLLSLSALLKLERPKSMFAFPKLRYATRTWDSSNGKLFISLPIIYPLLASLAISTRLIIVSRRMKRGPMDCRRCGYSLVGIESDCCPECGALRE